MNKRQWFVLVVLAGLFGTFGFFTYTRLEGELPDVAASTSTESDPDAPETESAESTAGEEGEGGEDIEATEAEDGEDQPDPDTIRVVGLGAESIAPGILANGGLEPGEESDFAAASLDVHMRAESTVTATERALSLGGDAEEGAHIVVMPLPSFVASYERLRALDPQVIGVAAWSHGRDALYGPTRESLMNSRRSRRPAPLCGRAGTPETFLALYLLELSGTAIGDIRIGESCQNGFRAVDRSGNTNTGAEQLIATSADASTLIPWVMIAPASTIEAPADRQIIQRWLGGWFEGVSALRHQAAESARVVATATNSDPVRILQHLGQIHVADLGQNARAFGLSGRGAMTVSSLFSETWRVWREAGVLVTPAPASPPVDSNLVALAARASEERPESPSTPQASFDTAPILQVALPSEEAELVHRIGWLADLFPRSGIEVQSPRRERDRDSLREEVLSRFGIEAGRLQTTQHRPGRVVVHSVE